jgi:hypothetical protein
MLQATRSPVVSDIFQWPNPSDRKMAMGSIQPVTKMSSMNISWWVKAADV